MLSLSQNVVTTNNIPLRRELMRTKQKKNKQEESITLCADINNPYKTKLMAYWSMRTLTWWTVFQRLVCAVGLCLIGNGQSESLLCAVATGGTRVVCPDINNPYNTTSRHHGKRASHTILRRDSLLCCKNCSTN
jgi:hypothetical protein